MTRLKKTLFWTGLGIYGLLLFLLLTLYRLPADKMLGTALTLFTGTQTLVSAETVSFSLPLSYALERITCEAHWPQGVSKDRIDSLIFGPEWSRLFSGSLPLKSEVIFARGRVESRVGVPFLGRGYFDAKGSGIHLEDLSFVGILLDRRVSGKCEGELRLTRRRSLSNRLKRQGLPASHRRVPGIKDTSCRASHYSFPIHQRLFDHSKGRAFPERRQNSRVCRVRHLLRRGEARRQSEQKPFEHHGQSHTRAYAERKRFRKTIPRIPCCRGRADHHPSGRDPWQPFHPLGKGLTGRDDG